MSADAAGVLRAGLEQGLAAYEAAQAAYDALIDGCHRITPEYLQQEAALEAARDAALCALPARSELARMLLRALAAQAEAGDESCPAGYCWREDSPRLGSLPVDQEAREAMRAERRAARAARAAAEEVG